MTDAANSSVLSLNGVSKRFGGITALNDVSLDVSTNGIVGLIGPNGAGKTTIFNVITGAYHANSGQVRLGAREISGLPPYKVARAGVARTFQNVRLFRSMTVWEHLLVAQTVSGGLLKRLVSTSGPSSAARERAEEILELFGLQEVREARAISLPFGVQRRVEVARALAAQPAILLLDEPAAGMNHDEGEELRSLLHRVRERGMTILLIEHDMPFVMSLCDYLYVLDFGALISEGTPEQVQVDPAVLEAYLGKEN